LPIILKSEGNGVYMNKKIISFSNRYPTRKRLLDITLSLPLLSLSLAIIGLTSVIIKLTDKGPVFHRQKVVGEKGAVFIMYKMRSLPLDFEVKYGINIVNVDLLKHTTAIGRFIRKTSIDELPQLLNVLKGDMSMVGPRPELTSFTKIYQDTYKDYTKRNNFRPGITGLAQINGRKLLHTNIPLKLKYDLEYIDTWSSLRDLIILLKTIPYVISCKNSM